MRARFQQWILVLVCVLPSACGDGDRNAGEAVASPSLQGTILIVLDTLRADHVSSYGYSRQTTPELDRLAADGVRFEQVLSNAPWTLPSVAALLSASYPQRVFDGTLSTSIVEQLQAAGMATGATTEGGYVSRTFGFDRGFDYFEEEEGTVRFYRPGESRKAEPRGGIEHTFDAAHRWLAEHAGDRFFLLIHTYEPHTPYTSSTFTQGLDPGVIGPTLETEVLRRFRSGEIQLSDGEVEYAKALYDGDVHHADRFVGRLRKVLEELGLDTKTLLVVTSDHGEEFNDHYRAHTASHGHSLRDPLLLVPLVVYNPVETYPVKTVSGQVRLLDVMPTIAELMGVALEGPTDGASLVPLLRGRSTASRLVLAGHTKRGPQRVALRSGGFKLIEVVGDAPPGPALLPEPAPRQLYNLNVDPREQHNLAGERPELAEEMYQMLVKHYTALAEDVSIQPEVDAAANPELYKRLRSLGYIQ